MSNFIAPFIAAQEGVIVTILTKLEKLFLASDTEGFLVLDSSPTFWGAVANQSKNDDLDI